MENPKDGDTVMQSANNEINLAILPILLNRIVNRPFRLIDFSTSHNRTHLHLHRPAAAVDQIAFGVRETEAIDQC